jgi:hypothetical protein
MLIRSTNIRPFINKKEGSANDVSAYKTVYAFRAKPSTRQTNQIKEVHIHLVFINKKL